VITPEKVCLYSGDHSSSILGLHSSALVTTHDARSLKAGCTSKNKEREAIVDRVILLIYIQF